MIDRAEIWKNIKRIELQLKGSSANRNQGSYKSAFKGQGMMFSEVRNYHVGDDVRKIDWNVTARFREPHVKVFEQEMDKNVILLIDVSSSNLIAFEKNFKFMRVIEAVSTLLLSAQYEQLNFGALLFTDKKEAYIPPRKGRAHLLKILNILLDSFTENQKSSLKAPLEWFKKNKLKKSTLLIISDFKMDLSFIPDLAVLSSVYQIHLLRIKNTTELLLPKVGWIEILNPETGQSQWVNTNNRTSRNQWLEFHRNKEQVLDDACLKHNIPVSDLHLEKEVFDQIRNTFR